MKNARRAAAAARHKTTQRRRRPPVRRRTALAYADDLILISVSVVKLQMMLDIGSTNGTNLDIRFNPTKSCLFKIGKDFSKNVPDLSIYGQNNGMGGYH